MYDSILGVFYEFDDNEKLEIKNKALEILKQKYDIIL